MKNFNFKETDLKGAYLIDSFFISDERGTFKKDYSKEIFEKNGIYHDLKEVFYTRSKTGVLRGIHFQSIKEQTKLIRCISGKIFDVIVDLRRNSKTFGEWRGFYLSGENNKQIYVPKNFGHSYLALEPSIVSYKCGEKFYREYDDGIMWNDPKIGIKWPLDLVNGDVTLSDKDKNLQSFETFQKKNK